MSAKEPAESIAIPVGALKLAAVPRPLLDPGVPEPARVVRTPVEAFTQRTALLPLSTCRQRGQVGNQEQLQCRPLRTHDGNEGACRVHGYAVGAVQPPRERGAVGESWRARGACKRRHVARGNVDSTQSMVVVIRLENVKGATPDASINLPARSSSSSNSRRRYRLHWLLVARR